MLIHPRSNLRYKLTSINYAGGILRTIALSKLIIFSAALLLSMPSPSVAGIILVEEEKARQKELQERQKNERSNSNTSKDSAPRSSQANTGKNETGLKKKSTETNLIFGF